MSDPVDGGGDVDFIGEVEGLMAEAKAHSLKVMRVNVETGKDGQTTEAGSKNISTWMKQPNLIQVP